MTNNENAADQMTHTERVVVDNAIEVGAPIAMIAPNGRTVKVSAERVAQRVAAGYTIG